MMNVEQSLVVAAEARSDTHVRISISPQSSGHLVHVSRQPAHHVLTQLRLQTPAAEPAQQLCSGGHPAAFQTGCRGSWSMRSSARPLQCCAALAHPQHAAGSSPIPAHLLASPQLPQNSCAGDKNSSNNSNALVSCINTCMQEEEKTCLYPAARSHSACAPCGHRFGSSITKQGAVSCSTALSIELLDGPPNTVAPAQDCCLCCQWFTSAAA